MIVRPEAVQLLPVSKDAVPKLSVDNCGGCCDE